MSDQQTAVVSRHKRDEATPPAPLDRYVTALVLWIASTGEGVVTSTLSRRAADACNWPRPFADAVIAAAKGRRLLGEVGPASGGRRSILSVRGRSWLANANQPEPCQSDTVSEGGSHQ